MTTDTIDAAQDAAADTEADRWAFGSVDFRATDDAETELKPSSKTKEPHKLAPKSHDWTELLFDADGKPAGFTDACIADELCAKRPGWTHKPTERVRKSTGDWKTPLL